MSTSLPPPHTSPRGGVIDVHGSVNPGDGHTAAEGAPNAQSDRSGAGASATSQGHSPSGAGERSDDESSAIDGGSGSIKGKRRAGGDGELMPAQLSFGSSPPPTSSSTNLDKRGDGGGELVWQGEGESPIDGLVYGAEIGRREPTHAAGGASITSGRGINRASEPADGGEGGAAVHDSQFYRNDADCVIRVEDTLFRVSGAFKVCAASRAFLLPYPTLRAHETRRPRSEGHTRGQPLLLR